MRQSTLSSLLSCISSASPKTYISKDTTYITVLKDVTNVGQSLLVEEDTCAPRAKRRRCDSYVFDAQDMEIDSSSNMSDMSIEEDPVAEEPKIRNIDEGASLEESPEYAEDIDNYLRKLERQFKPKAGYMSKQRYITAPHRSTVVDWMFEVN